MRDLEDQILKENLKKHKMNLEHQQDIILMEKKHQKALSDMRTALGFIFGQIGLQENQVPKDI